ncbi:MAG: MFS transporter [Hamadaea sp.]|nr:MFS transporter [Hamadaea sp.]
MTGPITERRSAAAAFLARTRAGTHALRGRAFRRFWLSQTLSGTGESLVQLALPFVVLAAGGTPLSLGLVLTAYGVARVVALPLAGVIADIASRRLIMLLAEAVKMIVHIVLSAALFTGHAHIWHLVLGSIAYGLAYGTGMPAATGVVPQLVGRELLQEANALVSLSRNAAQIAGFAVSGVLIAAFDPEIVYVLGGAFFGASALALAGMPNGTVIRSQSRSLLRDLVQGWSELAVRRWYWINLITHWLWNLAYAAFFVIGPIIAVRSFGGSTTWSLMSIAVAIGGLTGAAVALYVATDRPLLHGNLAMALAALPFLALATHSGVGVLVVATGVAFAGPAFLNVVWVATLQDRIPDHLLARLSSYDWAFSLAALPIGSAMAGWSVDSLGVPTTLAWALVCCLVPGAVALVDGELRTFRRTGAGDVMEPVAAVSGSRGR